MVLLTAPLDGEQQPRLYARHFRGAITYREVLRTLPYFRSRVGTPLYIIWDHLCAHTAKVVQRYFAEHASDFQEEWLPGYSPELNPEEQCNHWVKRELENSLPSSVDELLSQTRRGFRRLQHKPRILAGFFRHAGLDLNCDLQS